MGHDGILLYAVTMCSQVHEQARPVRGKCLNEQCAVSVLVYSFSLSSE